MLFVNIYEGLITRKGQARRGFSNYVRKICQILSSSSLKLGATKKSMRTKKNIYIANREETRDWNRVILEFLIVINIATS